MFGRAKAFMLVAALAAVTAVPVAGHAQGFVADCDGVVAPGATATCTSTWVDDQPGFVSQVITHGNFHELLAMGTVSLDWIDGAGNNVMHSDCLSPGLAVNIPSANPTQSSYIGPFDLQSFTCNTTYSADPPTYVEGTQTLLVTAKADSCLTDAICKFHGHIEISPPGALF